MINELLGNSKRSAFPNIPECQLPHSFCPFFEKRIASIRSELDSQPADGTPTPHSIVDTELCGLEPMSQELVRKLLRDSAPKNCVLHPDSTALLKTYLDDVVPF